MTGKRGRPCYRQLAQKWKIIQRFASKGFGACDGWTPIPRLWYVHVHHQMPVYGLFSLSIIAKWKKKDPRMAPMQRHSISDYESLRPHSASNIQGFYAAQRYQGRPSEAEQMIQAKRRMAAQRERELRNYHQEQQYNRST